MFAGHCKRLVPVWKELAAELRDNDKVVVAHVDCTTDRDVCQSAEVGFFQPVLAIHARGD